MWSRYLIRPFHWALRLLFAMAAVLTLPSLGFAQSETIEYYGLDALGSVRVIFGQQGNVIDRMDYGPFGENLKAAIKFPTEQFAQLARDAESGQDYARARNYSPAVGRFGSIDPMYAGLFNPQGWNRYMYALNNPIGLSDASGLNADFKVTSDPACVTFNCDFQRQMEAYWAFGSGWWGNSDYPNDDQAAEGGFTPSPAPGPVPGPTPGPTPPAPCDPITGAGCTPSIPGAFVDGFWKGTRDTFKALLPGSPGPESCLAVFAKSTVSNLVPISPSLAAAAEPVAMYAAQQQTTAALQYAASRPNVIRGVGLLFPFKSNVFRGMFNQAQTFARSGFYLSADLAIWEAVKNEWDAASRGDCR